MLNQEKKSANIVQGGARTITCKIKNGKIIKEKAKKLCKNVLKNDELLNEDFGDHEKK